MSYSALDEILARYRWRANQLESEYEEATTQLRTEIDARDRELEDGQAEAERQRGEAEPGRSAEQVATRRPRPRARSSRIDVDDLDEDYSQRSWLH